MFSIIQILCVLDQKTVEEDTTIDSMVLIVLVLTNVNIYTSALEFE